MKKAFLSFLALLSPLFSEAPSLEDTPEIQHSWDHNDSYLFLDIELDTGLQFADTYQIFELQDKNPGAEIHFLLLENCPFVKKSVP